MTFINVFVLPGDERLSCPERQRYIVNVNSLSELENSLDGTLTEIRSNLNSAAQVRGDQRSLPLKRRSDGQILQTLPDYVRVWILKKKTWRQIFGPDAKRGAYIPRGNKILLEEDNWCRKTMVHESLHSVSIFSDPRNRDRYEMTRLFAEGATEFMTGLLLFRGHTDCYENWRFGRFPQWCSVTYPRETKTFLAFCGCANAESLLDLYFATQTNDLSLAWSGFITSIRQYTGTRFKDVFKEAERIGLYIAFRNECERQFGKKFRKLQKLIDYNRIF